MSCVGSTGVRYVGEFGEGKSSSESWLLQWSGDSGGRWVGVVNSGGWETGSEVELEVDVSGGVESRGKDSGRRSGEVGGLSSMRSDGEDWV